MKTRVALGLAAPLALLAFLGGGCNSNTICTADTCTNPDDPNNPMVQPGMYESLVVDPAEATLTAVNGQKPQQQFTVRGKRKDGTLSDPLRGLWSVSSNALGAVDPAAGVFSSTGEVGGSLQVRVEVAQNGAAPLLGAATLRVQVKRQIILPGAPGDAPTIFNGPSTMDAAKAAQILYPLDKAVMPQNVFPATVQWERGGAGDLFHVRLQKANVQVDAYAAFAAGFTNSWQVEGAAWRGVAQSDPDQPAQITVDRYEAASKAVYSGAPVAVRFAKGSLLGSVYYWDIEKGRILRIDDGTAQRVAFMPSPPMPAVGTDRCVGCHGVSQDGRYMVGRLGGGDNAGTVFDLTQDLTGDPAPSRFGVSAASTRWMFASFNPDGTRLLTSTVDMKMQLVNPQSGQVIAAQGLVQSATYPRWSPDGKRVAYVTNADEWGSAPTKGDLAVLPVTGADSFGAPQVLLRGDGLAGAQPAGAVVSYPTWSPDGKWIVFAHGGRARSENGTGALYVINGDGGKTARLNNAVGLSTDNNFVPAFSPFNSGGYFWLMFLSRRDYGNAQAGTKGSMGRQQLWVTAIRNNPTAGEDPSEVPYWLPGQDTQSRNISGYWAPKACRKDLEACSVGSECCGGLCVANKCQPPPQDQCRQEGQTCGGGGCCPGLQCDRTNICSSVLG